MLKYVVFDFDGTLVDSQDIFVPIYNQLAENHGYKTVREEDIEPLRKLSISERCKQLHVPIYKLPFLAVEFYKLYQPAIKDLVLFNGMKGVLDELHRKGYEIAIISSNSEEHIRAFLHNNQMENIQDVFCSKNLFGKDKIIKKFLKAKKIEEKNMVYVGDEQRDIVACKKVGVNVIWVGWGYDVMETIKEDSPDYMVNTPNEILQVVQSVHS
ncbi:HAD family hydrolase [Bacillus bingmayongensis]|uniref:HAD family hydrolase n=1 Tax=Bacillus bingmayongensis TaxID=1150157 RepID=UPI00031DDFBB|nr:HAD family hydrolase [Bacillus bingmayongensis]MBY0595194.1 HAD family hydrolase [Bacillus bingmayongensis]